MKYTLTEPCDQCPFLKGSPLNKTLSRSRIAQMAAGEFPCHKACKVEEDEDGSSGYVPRNDKTPHCAGALIYLEKRNKPHQMMRICERIGMYDRTKLNMKANVL